MLLTSNLHYQQLLTNWNIHSDKNPKNFSDTNYQKLFDPLILNQPDENLIYIQ